MSLINVANIINMLSISFQIATIVITPVNEREVVLHDTISELIKSAVDNEFDIDHDWGLDFDNPSEPHDVQMVDVHDIEADEDSFDGDQVCTMDLEGDNINLDYKINAVEYWKSGKKSRLSLSSVQARFRKVKSTTQLYRWEEHVTRGGSNRDKYRFIAEYVLMKFQDALDRKSIIHDINLRKWALKAKEESNFPSFRAGRWWLWNFKKAHRISSRKITKFQSGSSRITTENQNRLRSAEEFVQSVKPHIVAIGHDFIYNADESGFNLEIHSGRTLAAVGTKRVEATVQSLSSMTHSYTIVPIISASGQLLSPLYVVLKEPSGAFGPRVEESLFRPANVYIAASKSGKLTSQHFRTWFQEIFLQNTGDKSLLLIDSWTGHCSEDLQRLVPNNKQVQILNIPKKTTDLIQPLDVFTFRIWKSFVRTFSDAVLLYEIRINLHSRNNIIKLQSLTHNQLSSPRFKNVFKYAWYKSGYIDTRPDKFDNPVDYCYFKEEKRVPLCSICGEVAFIRCAWCKKYLCFKHFFEENHYCSIFEM